MIEGYEALEGLAGEGTLKAMHGYAIVLQDQGKLEEAGRVNREVIEGKTATFGANHDETLKTKGN